MYTVGIIGFGVVGLAGLKFFITHPAQLRKFLNLPTAEPIRFVVWDQKEQSIEHAALFANHNVEWVLAADSSLASFFVRVDKALVSPGVNLTSVPAAQQKKVFCELDLLQHNYHHKSIGITGSLGKTTVTKLIYQLLKRVHTERQLPGSVALGGNVGIGMLDLLDDAIQNAWVVLELSSFQLERSASFAPTIALWTNLYPNHLDRHVTLAGYFAAKANLFRQQPADAVTVLGTQLFNESMLGLTTDLLAQLKSSLVIAGTASLTEQFIRSVPRQSWTAWMVRDGVLGKFCIDAGVIMASQPLLPVSALPICTFVENWAAIFAVLDAAGADCAWLVQDLQRHPEFYSPEDQHHRLEFVRRWMGIDFYNDSKSTVKESTLAAAEQLAGTYKRVHVIIGGLGKGVDRSDFVARLRQSSAVATVMAFGNEASLLAADTSADTLDQVLDKVLGVVGAGDVVLFSPGGASFDLFKNYEHRGERFKELVVALGT